MTVRNLFLLPGDGIGPEAMAEVRKIIAHMNAEMAGGFTTDEGLVGGSAYDAHGAAISDGVVPPGMSRDGVASDRMALDRMISSASRPKESEDMKTPASASERASSTGRGPGWRCDNECVRHGRAQVR